MNDWEQMGIALETLPVYASTVHEESAAASTDGTECTRYNIIGLNDPGILYDSLHTTLFKGYKSTTLSPQHKMQYENCCIENPG